MTENNTNPNEQPLGDSDRTGLPRTLSQVCEDIASAITLLTRIPMPNSAMSEGTPISRAVWAFPIAGAIVGVFGAAAFELSHILGMTTSVSVLIALAAMTLASGALHEDGLADFWDGLGGGNDTQSRLEIMRDSRIGTYGALALGFTLALQALLLIALSKSQAQWPMWCVILSAATISRTALLLPMAILPSARATGLGAKFSNASKPVYWLGVSLTTMLTVILLGLLGAWLAITGAFVMSALITVLAHRYLGGQTGDVLGAAATMSFVGALIAMAISGAHW